MWVEYEYPRGRLHSMRVGVDSVKLQSLLSIASFRAAMTLAISKGTTSSTVSAFGLNGGAVESSWVGDVD